MPGPHDKIIADAAKAALGPLDFRRNGRSRTWLADHGWWLTVVEFQPSSWSKGSYLNVAAHWLWSDTGHLSFDYGGRTADFEEYANDDQFAPSAQRLAQAAAVEAGKLNDAFGSIETTADILMTDEASLRDEKRGSWSTYNAGVAAALAGHGRDADTIFQSVSDERAKAAAVRLVQLLSEPVRLRDEVVSLVARQRKAIGLPELTRAPF